jgi:hypothetical protein
VGDDALDNDGLEAPVPRWHGAITWAGLAAAGLILYELTNQPAVGVATLCLKFGWEDFKTAFWLRRVDPNRARGRACWWMCVAWGSLKVVGMALIMGPVVEFGAGVWQHFGNAGGHDRLVRAVTGAGYTLAVGMGLFSLATIRVIWLATGHRLRLWLHPSINRARRYESWPPYDFDGVWSPNDAAQLQENRLCIPWAVSTLVVVFASELIPQLIPGLKAAKWVPAALLLPIIFASIKLCGPITARNPGECWRPDEVTAPAGDPLQ